MDTAPARSCRPSTDACICAILSIWHGSVESAQARSTCHSHAVLALLAGSGSVGRIYHGVCCSEQSLAWRAWSCGECPRSAALLLNTTPSHGFCGLLHRCSAVKYMHHHDSQLQDAESISGSPQRGSLPTACAPACCPGRAQQASRQSPTHHMMSSSRAHLGPPHTAGGTPATA